jgi:hypothetical protein
METPTQMASRLIDEKHETTMALIKLQGATKCYLIALESKDEAKIAERLEILKTLANENTLEKTK